MDFRIGRGREFRDEESGKFRPLHRRWKAARNAVIPRAPSMPRRSWSPAIRGVLLAGIPNLSIYLYTRLLLSLSFLASLARMRACAHIHSPSLSLSRSLARSRFFSPIKIYAHSCSFGACISRFVSRDARFAPSYAHAQHRTPLFLRVTDPPPPLLSCLSAEIAATRNATTGRRDSYHVERDIGKGI